VDVGCKYCGIIEFVDSHYPKEAGNKNINANNTHPIKKNIKRSLSLFADLPSRRTNPRAIETRIRTENTTNQI
jgi:hypothetical protein